jgi:hypothetical protein
MKSLAISTQKNSVWVRVAALALIVVTILVPQLTWADHASDHPDRQVAVAKNHNPGRDLGGVYSPSGEAYAALVAKYKAGELVFQAPGRGDDGSASVSANPELIIARRYYPTNLARSTDVAFLAANPEVMISRRGYAASLVQAADAAFLAANPEVMTSRRYASSGGCYIIGLAC